MELFCCVASGAVLHTMYIAQCTDFIYNGNDQLESLHGNHQQNLSDADVTDLQIQIQLVNQNLTFVPEGLSKIIPNLVFLTIVSKIQTISADDLSGLSKLEYFTSSNPIKYLPGNLFRGNPNLKQVFFTPNLNEGIEEIGANLLGCLRNLQSVTFKGKCLSESATNRLQILNLNQFLHILCPSDDQTDCCPVGCHENFERLQQENDNLKSRVEELEKMTA